MSLFRGTEPHVRESQDCERLSPIMKYFPSGTCLVMPKCDESASRSLAEMYDSFSFTNRFSPGPLIQMKPWSSSFTVSPGRPITRLTNVPPSPHLRAASLGVLKTTMSPRDGLRPKSRQMRQASTRSLELPRQPGFACPLAQLRFGSIDDDGMRYGLTTHCLSASTIRIAPAMVRIQSSVTRTLRGRPGKRRASGSRLCGAEYRSSAASSENMSSRGE